MNSRFKERGPSHSSLVAGLGVSIRGGGGFGGDENEKPQRSRVGRRALRDGNLSREPRVTNLLPGVKKLSTDENSVEPISYREYARVTLDRNGKVTVYTGSSPHGQGEETTFAQLASEELGLPLDSCPWFGEIQSESPTG